MFILLTLMGMTLSAIPSFAASPTSGAAFLALDSNARPAALAGAYTSAAGDLDSLYYNPGGLAAMSRQQFMFTHAEWLVNTSYDQISFGQPLHTGTLAGSIARMNYGTLDGRDTQGAPTGNFTSADTAGILSYSRFLGPAVGVGVSGKFLYSQIGQDHASTFALDAGAITRWPGRRIWLGAAVLNLGPGLQFLDQRDPLPLTFALGAATQPFDHLALTLDLKRQPYDRSTTLSSGVEYAPLPLFTLRLGYVQELSSYVNDNSLLFQNFRAGVGFWLSRYRIDYTAAPFGDLGLTHRITLSLFFRSKEEPNSNINLLPSNHFIRRVPDTAGTPSDPNDDDLLELLNKAEQEPHTAEAH